MVQKEVTITYRRRPRPQPLAHAEAQAQPEPQLQLQAQVERKMMYPASLQSNIGRSLVTINVPTGRIKDPITYQDGIIVAVKPNSAYVIAHAEIFTKSKKNIAVKNVTMTLPNGKIVDLQQSNFHFNSDVKEGNDIVGIKFDIPDGCAEDLVAIDFDEGELKPFDPVYTYSEGHLRKMLSPGEVIFAEEDLFEHSCASFEQTACGSAVINKDGKLVGMCYDYEGYLISFTTSAIAFRIERNQKRVYTGIQAAINFLRQ